MKRLISAIVCGLILTACGSKPDNRTVYQKEKRYPHPQNLRIPVALFIRERVGAPTILASAFLCDKKGGLFASAKHFVGTNADGDCKIFFNGRVYDGALVKVPPTTDIAIIKIVERFNPADFPEPYPIARNTQKGERVFIRGIHPHPKQMQNGKIIIPIFRTYYGVDWNPMELVFDDLEGTVINLAKEITNRNMGITPESIAEISNTYIELKTVTDHTFSFGGLSGGPTVNESGELVGINSNETQAHWEIDLERRKATYHPWDNMNIVPAAELEKLLSQLINNR